MSRTASDGAVDIALALPELEGKGVSALLTGDRLAVRWLTSSGFARTIELQLFAPVTAEGGAVKTIVLPHAVLVMGLLNLAAAGSSDSAGADEWPRLLHDAETTEALAGVGDAPFFIVGLPV